MPNPIKYTTGSESDALVKGNFRIGTGSVGKGPSDTTGYYQGPSVPSGGYVIYMNREGAPGDLSYHVVANDAELISFTNNLAGQSYTTVNECLVYYAGQNDKVCLNRDYEGIVTDGLVLNVDAGFTPSYPKNGTTWYDVGGTNNGTLTNGPTFSGGSIVFDGVDDYVGWNTLPEVKWQNWSSITIETVFKLDSYNGGTFGRQYLFDYRDSGGVNGAIGCFYDSINSPNGFKLFYNTVGTGFEEPKITTFSLGTLIYHQVTFDKTTSTNNIRHYINGSNVFTRSITINSNTTNNGRVWLGRYAGGGYQWNGNIFLHRVYNRALSADEVLQNYNAQKGRFGL